MIVIAGLASCEGPIGPIGTDGVDGVDGVDGTDGNANVQTYIYNNPVWGNGSGMYIDMSSVLTNEIIQNNVILGYVKHTGVSYATLIPGDVWTGLVHRNYTMFVNGSPTTYSSVPEYNIMIVSLELDGTYTPNADLKEMEWFKVVIIEPTNITTTEGNGKSLSPKQAIYNELENAGVDINDYYQVMDYYNLEY
ncbi:MAG: hypothetical protein L3J35_13295 [Bacteroidales bacterium]|nr:hypothetical protein [Bacteroidales bacterium]